MCPQMQGFSFLPRALLLEEMEKPDIIAALKLLSVTQNKDVLVGLKLLNHGVQPDSGA